MVTEPLDHLEILENEEEQSPVFRVVSLSKMDSADSVAVNSGSPLPWTGLAIVGSE